MLILELLAPVFAIILTGAIFGHYKLLPEGAADVLIQFAFWVAIPALLFHIIAEESIDRLLDVAFYMSFGVALAVIFLAVFFVARNFAKKPTGEATMLAFLAVGSNTAFVALPVLHSVYGEKAVLPTAIATVVLIVLILVTTVLLERSRDDRAEGSSSIVAATGHALLNPLVLSTVLAVAYAVTGWPLPATAKHYLSMLGAAVTPCALFAIGMSIKLEDMRTGAGAILGISVIKLVVFPAGVLLTALLLDLNPILGASATICAAVPVGKTAFVLASNYHLFPERVASMISVSSVASAVTLTAWLFILAHVYGGAMPS